MNTPQVNEAKRFIEVLNRGFDSLVEAGAIAASEVDKDPSFIDKVCKLNPLITPETVQRFVDIGRRVVHPRLCLSDSPGVRALRRLPYSLQEKYVSQPVEMLIEDGQTLLVDPLVMTKDQANQVFGESGVRTLSAQKAIIEDVKSKRSQPKKAHDDYHISRGSLVISRPCTLSRKQLAELLARME